MRFIMAVGNLLKGFGGAGKRPDARQSAEGDLRLQVLDDFELAGIGWIWASDADGRLIYLSSAVHVMIRLYVRPSRWHLWWSSWTGGLSYHADPWTSACCRRPCVP